MTFDEIVETVDSLHLVEMARPLQKVREDLSSIEYFKTRFMHLILIYYFRDNRDTEHWKKEVVNFVPRSLLVKGRNKRLSKDEIFHLIWLDKTGDPSLSYEEMFRVVKEREQNVERPSLDWESVVEDKDRCLSFIEDFHSYVAGVLSSNDEVRLDQTKDTIDILLEGYAL